MKWYGILALVFIFFVLGSIVYIGANTDKFGFEMNFGEPSQISKKVSNPSSMLNIEYSTQIS